MTNRRRLAAAAALVGVVLLSGCLGVFGGSVSDQRLDQEPAGGSYAWNQSADVHITVHTDATFEAVYTVNRSELTLYREDGLGGRNPLSVRAVRYRYPNGTVINGSTLQERGAVEQTRSAVVIRFPGTGDVEGDQVAFTASSSPKRFSLPTYVDGSYEVVLPPNRRVSMPVFGQVSPGDYDTRVDDAGRLHITWADVGAEHVVVQFYTMNDLRMLAALVGLLALIGGGGLLYFRYQIRELRRQREELGLDVDIEDDDFGRDPPPGMR
ncbi:DUF5803 family protein [Halobaculum sp. D14]|uniref:DUF5803 family protein n=1 Tax=Halobaculum sp. D14 TaxID=3421642 RepID=UPI003EC110CA